MLVYEGLFVVDTFRILTKFLLRILLQALAFLSGIIVV